MSVSLHHLRHSQWPSQDSPAADISREEQEASDLLWPPHLLLHPERGSSRLDMWDQWSGMLGQWEGDLWFHLLFAVKPHCLLGTSSLCPAAGPQVSALSPSLSPTQRNPHGDFAPLPYNLPLGSEKEMTQLRSEKADDAQEGEELGWLPVRGRGALKPTEDMGQAGQCPALGHAPPCHHPLLPSFLEV